MYRRGIVCVLLFGVVILRAVVADEKPPIELIAPDKRHFVKMLHHALPGSDPYSGFFTLTVCAGDRVLSRFPTTGFLIDAFWSPDGKYVAVDNRRANSGDYLCVFRLSDGVAIKLPDDQAPDGTHLDYETATKPLVARVSTKFPEYTWNSFNKRFTFATGWRSANELQVKSNVAFRNLDDGVMEVFDIYRVSDTGLQLLEEHIE